MNDLYGTSGAIALGNMRSKEVRDYNDRVRNHNDNVTNTIQGLKDQAQNITMIKEIKDQATNLWTAKDIPGKVAEYNKWKASLNAPNPTEGSARRSAEAPEATTEPAPAVTEAGEDTTEAGGEAISEGANAGETVSEVAETSEGAGGAVAKGILKDGEGVVEASKFGKFMGKAGVLGSAALGGMDLYEDLKGGKIQGNNTWEKASNVLQIGGSIADLVGVAFPPAKLLGAGLDLASGITDSVGEKLDEDKTSDDLTAQGKEQTETTEKTTQLERQDPSLVATTGLTAVTSRVQ
jgi:hypothetical protein